MPCFVETKVIMKHTSEQMQLVISKWQTSGLSKKEFCRQQDITYQTFHYWYKRLTSAPAAGFTEISVQGHDSTGRSEIVFPSGVRMILHGEPSASWLRELLR